MFPYYPIYTLEKPFAEEGDKTIPKTSPDESTEGRATLDEGFPPVTQMPVNKGGIAPHRWDFNGILHILSSMSFWKQSGGQMKWSSELSYTAPNIVLYGGVFYTSVEDSGPDSDAGPIVPGTDETYWVRLIDYLTDGMGLVKTGDTVTLTGDTTGSGAFDSSGNCSVSTTTEQAAQLKTQRSIQTKLDSTSVAWFDGTANVTPGVTGILAIANGGTGNSVGLAQDSLKWDGASKTVSAVSPTGGSNGDIWFQYIT